MSSGFVSDTGAITPGVASGIDDSEREARVMLAGLSFLSPRRLRTLLSDHAAVEIVAMLAGRESLPDDWGGLGVTPEDVRRRIRCGDYHTVESLSAIGIHVVVRGAAGYPPVLVDDPEAPEVLFFQGDLSLLEHRRVGVVGTRNATAAGRATATQLGSELAAAGVSVVSGLARGIDASAHHGVRNSGVDRAVAVVGSGLDVHYPRQNRSLWEWVGSNGLLMSEWPPGSPPEAWHFPLRNRIIAALSEVVIVVESRETGGSLITADAALRRGVDVMAVPGSTHCRAALGTNRLIADGAGLVSSCRDVFEALDIAHCHRLPVEQSRCNGEQLVLPSLGNSHRSKNLIDAVLQLCRDRPMTLDELVTNTGGSVLEVARVVTELEHCGEVRDSNGWMEAIGSRLDR